MQQHLRQLIALRGPFKQQQRELKSLYPHSPKFYWRNMSGESFPFTLSFDLWITLELSIRKSQQCSQVFLSGCMMAPPLVEGRSSEMGQGSDILHFLDTLLNTSYALGFLKWIPPTHARIWKHSANGSMLMVMIKKKKKQVFSLAWILVFWLLTNAQGWIKYFWL